MYYIVVRKSRPEDEPQVSSLVRNVYLSGVSSAWINSLFNEVTFQAIILLAAVMFIVFGVPLLYCILAVPVTLLVFYAVIYLSLLSKSAEVMYNRRSLECWVAEAYEPFFFSKDPKVCWYKLVGEADLQTEGVNEDNFQKSVVGSVALQRHNSNSNWVWLFRLAVDGRYRRKGIALKLVESAKNWCQVNHYGNIELAMSECQSGAREFFDVAGFHTLQLYYKKLFTPAVSLQMFKLRCEVI